MTEDNAKAVPVYVSFTTFRNFLDLIKADGVPPKIDTSMLAHMSGSSSGQLRTGLKYLGLTDEDGQTNQMLERLVYADDEERPDILTEVLRSAYGFLFNSSDDFDLSKGTFRQFEERFKEQGASGATIRKAERFFVQAAEYSGIPISPYIVKGMKGRRTTGTTPKPKNGNSSRSNASATQKRVQGQPTDKSEKQTPSPQNGQRSQSPPSNTDSPPTRQMTLDELLSEFALLKAMIHKLPKTKEWTKAKRDHWLFGFTNWLDYEITVIEDEKEVENSINEQ